MGKEHRVKRGSIWASVLVLAVLVLVSGYVLTSRLNQYVLDDSGAVSLIDGTITTTTTKTTQPKAKVTRSGFEIVDDEFIWDTTSEVDIFKVSYENDEQIITVNGEDGEHVVAPGTENSYTFKFNNTGDVAVDYELYVEVYVTPADVEIPLTARLSRYDETWFVGDVENYEPILALHGVEDAETLGAGKYTYYTIDWQWPYESGNDEFDTFLGNMAEEEELTVTIKISTTATACEDPDRDDGLTPPKTGDDNTIIVCGVIAIVCIICMILLGISRRREERCVVLEADGVENRREKKS